MYRLVVLDDFWSGENGREKIGGLYERLLKE